MITVGEYLERTARWLRERGAPTPKVDADNLLSHLLGIERLQLYLMYDRPLTDDELAALRPLVRRRGQREPLAWITGHKGFHALDLLIQPGVLVPRPDTEVLVEAALEWIDADRGEDDETPVYVADMGSGSGAVGLALAHAREVIRVYATDVADAALAVTKANVDKLDLGRRVAVLRGPWLDPIPANRRIDWVVSNPPYIPTRVIDTLQPEVSTFEPREALDGGRDGLVAYHELVPRVRARARKGLLVEVGHDQAEAVSALLTRHGFEEVRTWQDYGGHERVVAGRIPTSEVEGD